VAEILRGHLPAVTLSAWAIRRTPPKQRGDPAAWELRGRPVRVDAFQARQSGLIFTARRPGGYWCWPVRALTHRPDMVIATLGPPEM
jgi:hypothetical protein